MKATAWRSSNPLKYRVISPFSALVAALLVAIFLALALKAPSLLEAKNSISRLPNIAAMPAVGGIAPKTVATRQPGTTRMRLLGLTTLRGGAKTGLAMIDVEDRGPQLFRVGDQLAANVSLIEIGDSYAIVEEAANRRALVVEGATSPATTRNSGGDRAELRDHSFAETSGTHAQLPPALFRVPPRFSGSPMSPSMGPLPSTTSPDTWASESPPRQMTVNRNRFPTASRAATQEAEPGTLLLPLQ